MNNKWIKKISLVFVAILALPLMLSNGTMADNSVVKVTREAIGQSVVGYSPMLKGMEQRVINLTSDYSDLKERTKGLNNLYQQLAGYNKLYNGYGAMSPNYQSWLMASAAVINNTTDPALTLTLAEMTDGDYLAIVDQTDPNFGRRDDGPDGNTISGTDELTLKGEIDSGQMMSPREYLGYLGLQKAFTAVGITNPNLSKEERFEKFVYPIEIAPMALQSGLEQLQVGKDQAEAGLKSGAESLYDGTLVLEGYKAIQKMSYDMAVDALGKAKKSYELGQLSESDYAKKVNEEEIAKLQYDTMVRKVKNLKMNLNVMLGQPVLTALALEKKAGNLVALKSLDYYVQRGLDQRAEMINNTNATNNKSSLLSVYEDNLGDDSIEFFREDNQIKDLKLEKTYLEKVVESDIINAYRAVSEKIEAYRISKLKMEDSLRQKKDMALYKELGFVTETTIKGLNIQLTQSTNEHYKAYRDYLAAIATLELQSGIGQGTGPATTEGE